MLAVLTSVHFETYLVLSICGLLAGFLAGLFGIGGGLVIVPCVFFLLSFQGLDGGNAMTVAICTSLFAILPTALTSAYSHHRLGNIDAQLVRQWAPFLALGIVVGASCVSEFRTPLFIAFFACLLLFVALYKWLWVEKLSLGASLPSAKSQAAWASLIGFLSALAGVGGGSLSVPILKAYALPMRRAIGNSAAFGVLIAAIGSATIILKGESLEQHEPGVWGLVYWPALLVLLPLTVATAPLGARLTSGLSERMLSRLFSALLLVVGLRMLYKAASEIFM